MPGPALLRPAAVAATPPLLQIWNQYWSGTETRAGKYTLRRRRRVLYIEQRVVYGIYSLSVGAAAVE